MPSYLDLGLIVIVLISALLSMVRGFTREVLAIGSWAAAAAAAYFFYPYLVPYVSPYIHKEPLPAVISAAVIFFVALIIVSILTVRISDAILDSKVGALDRSLGFLFGAARGFLLGVVAFAIFNWLVAEKQQPEWVKDAKTRPILMETADRVIAHAARRRRTYDRRLVEEDQGRRPRRPRSRRTNSLAAPPDRHVPRRRAAAAAKKADIAPAPAAGAVAPTDKQKLDAILNKPAAPAKPTRRPNLEPKP